MENRLPYIFLSSEGQHQELLLKQMAEGHSWKVGLGSDLSLHISQWRPLPFFSILFCRQPRILFSTPISFSLPGADSTSLQSSSSQAPFSRLRNCQWWGGGFLLERERFGPTWVCGLADVGAAAKWPGGQGLYPGGCQDRGTGCPA